MAKRDAGRAGTHLRQGYGGQAPGPPDPDLGLYVHIPFCQAICSYCNFNRGLLDVDLKRRYVSALDLEIRRAPGGSADTIFFGGGTPSLLDPAEVERLIVACRETFDVAAGAEVTLETNPETATIERLAAFRSWSWQLTGGAQAELLRGARVSADFFEAVGAGPMLGRTFTAEEDLPNRAPVAIISHGLWQRHFGGDPQVIGKTITLTGQNAIVVGVMPEGFQFPGRAK